MNKVNDAFKSLRIDKKVNVSIFYIAIELTINDEALTSEQAEMFLDAQRINYEFENCLMDITEIANYLPTHTQLSLLGFPNEGILESQESSYDFFSDEFLNLQDDVLKSKLSVDDFLEKLKELYKALPRDKDLKICA